MGALSIQVPYPVFYDREGQPLDDGNIYIGVANLDPLTNPLQVYYDEALTITASQPLKTSGGYVYRNGTPTQLYVNATDFSITVNDSKNLFVYNFPEATGIISYTGAQTVEYDPPFAGAVTSGYTVADKLEQYVSVQDFGAVGDNVADDTAAIQAAINYLINGNGGTLRVPAGLYKLTATLNVGLPIVTNYSFLTARTTALTDPVLAANSIPANISANQSKNHIKFEFDPGAMFVASWTPANPEPVIAYNLQDGTRTGFGDLSDVAIVSAVMITGGVYNLDAVMVPQTNKLIGIFTSRGCRRIKTPFISGIEHGIISMAGYWTRITDVYVWRAGGICLNVTVGNAMKIDNLAFWYSAKGLVFDGDASEVRGIQCQQVAQEIIIYQCDTCVFGPAYLEDVDATSGAGTYAVTLGQTGGALLVKHSEFTNIRCGAARPSKGAFRVWDGASVTFNGCRAYSKTVDYDATSGGTIACCDFSSTATNRAKWLVTGAGTFFASALSPGTDFGVQGPWMFNVPVTLGAIAAGASADFNYTLPAGLDNMTFGTAHFSYYSGGNPILIVSTRIVFSSPKVIRLTFANPTAASITPGTFGCALTVFASL